MILKYIKPLKFLIISALNNGDKNTTISLKAKKTFIKRLAFSKLLLNPIKLPIISFKIAHIKVAKGIVAQVLIN